MNEKLKLWNSHSSWEEAEKAWDQKAKELHQKSPLKIPSHLPSIPGITPETAKNLKWKAVSYLVKHDKNRVIARYFPTHPFKYAFSLLKSLFKKKPYLREGDFFLYGINSVEEFKTLIEDPQSLLVVGFSYCHKPHECPSGRFSTECIHDPEHPTCRQCFIGKAVNALPEKNVIPLFITTIHYIGEKIFEIAQAHPNKKVHFIITACEMTLEMFGDFGNMVGIQGIGVRLDGRICNTMKAFELSENGIKPGLTIVLEPTMQRILELIKHRRSHSDTTS
jgi:hypothetical protein